VKIDLIVEDAQVEPRSPQFVPRSPQFVMCTARQDRQESRFISPVLDAIRVRTGEHGATAYNKLAWPHRNRAMVLAHGYFRPPPRTAQSD